MKDTQNGKRILCALIFTAGCSFSILKAFTYPVIQHYTKKTKLMSRNIRNLIMNTFPFLNKSFIDIDTDNHICEIICFFQLSHCSLIKWKPCSTLQKWVCSACSPNTWVCSLSQVPASLHLRRLKAPINAKLQHFGGWIYQSCSFWYWLPLFQLVPKTKGAKTDSKMLHHIRGMLWLWLLAFQCLTFVTCSPIFDFTFDPATDPGT